MYTLIITSPFIEHPVVDIARFDAYEFDISIFEEEQSSNFLNKGVFHLKQYCTCVLHKLFTLNKSKVKPFIQYQCNIMQDPIRWLNKLEKLIDLNREMFNEKEHKIKFDKALVVIELIRESIENKNQTPTNTFDLKKVKIKLIEYEHFEDKLSYLCEVETEYKQQRPTIINSNEVPFDEQIRLEVEKLSKQQLLKEKSKQRIETFTEIKNKEIPKLQLTCNLNYFVDIFYQLANEKKLIQGSLKDLAEYISTGMLDKEGHPISADSVYTMLKPSSTSKRPKGTSRFELK